MQKGTLFGHWESTSLLILAPASGADGIFYNRKAPTIFLALLAAMAATFDNVLFHVLACSPVLYVLKGISKGRGSKNFSQIRCR
jgi:hypothetical protein